MKWEIANQQQCSVARASAVLGDRWTLIILSDIFLGVKRFDDMQARLGLSRTTLTNRLKLLEEHEVLVRKPYQDKPLRYEYRLTEKGRDLYPVLSTLLNWGDKYYAEGDAGPPIIRQHKNCGHDIQPILCCPQCHEEIDGRSIAARKRPSAPDIPDVLRGPFRQSA